MLWRLLQEGRGGAAWNMAYDEAILEAVRARHIGPTMRLYQWEKVAVTLGRFQKRETVLSEAECERLDVPVVRRITGGRGILHGDDLTISIVAPVDSLGLPVALQERAVALYERLAEGFLRAFQILGVDATMGACRAERDAIRHGNCFLTISRADVVEAKTGIKLLGAALHRRGETFLQQVSIPLYTESRKSEMEAWRHRLFAGEQGVIEPGFSFQAEALGEAICEGFQKTLSLSFTALPEMLGETTFAQENACAEALMASRYRNPAWTAGRLRPND